MSVYMDDIRNKDCHKPPLPIFFPTAKSDQNLPIDMFT